MPNQVASTARSDVPTTSHLPTCLTNFLTDNYHQVRTFAKKRGGAKPPQILFRAGNRQFTTSGSEEKMCKFTHLSPSLTVIYLLIYLSLSLNHVLLLQHLLHMEDGKYSLDYQKIAQFCLVYLPKRSDISKYVPLILVSGQGLVCVQLDLRQP